MIPITVSFFYKKDYIAEKYGKSARELFTAYCIMIMSFFSITLIVNGKDKVPTSNFILIQNHLSNMDPLISNVVFKDVPMIFVSKEGNFKIPFFGKFISKIGFIKLKRVASKEDVNEMLRAHKWLRNDYCSLGIYPEGTRNKSYPNPIMLDFKDGSFSLAKSCGKPLVVSVIHGTDKITEGMPFKRHKIQIDILRTYSVEEIEAKSVADLSSEVRNMMIEAITNKPSKKEIKQLY